MKIATESGLMLCGGTLALQALKDICDSNPTFVGHIRNISSNVAVAFEEMGWGHDNTSYFSYGPSGHGYDRDEVCMALAMLATLDPPEDDQDEEYRKQLERA